MPIRMISIIYRHPSLTPAEFKTYYEEKHIPLLQKVSRISPLETVFPQSCRRHYVERNQDGSAVVLQGQQADVDFDCMGVITFEDQAGMQAFAARKAEPANAKLVEESEGRFMDVGRGKAFMVGEVCVYESGK